MPPSLTSLVARGRALPWGRLYFVGQWVYRKGRAAHAGLTEGERAELGRLLRKSRGRRGNLTGKETDRLQAIVRKALRAARGA
jgi:hypothetical protein